MVSYDRCRVYSVYTMVLVRLPRCSLVNKQWPHVEMVIVLFNPLSPTVAIRVQL